jgi:putative ABC transport system permease protein
VFKENILLSVMGAAVGLVGGKMLLEFVISQVKVDMVWFSARLTFPSYVFAILLTLLTAVIVDFIFHFRLEKINMAEALKSVE